MKKPANGNPYKPVEARVTALEHNNQMLASTLHSAVKTLDLLASEVQKMIERIEDIEKGS